MQRDLEAIRPVLEDMIGRPSRWSGRLSLISDPDRNGAKPFSCDIVINTRLTGQDVRWRTLIHEMLHTFSAGYNSQSYQTFRGWEEGVVEQTQRRLRPALLMRLGVTVNEAVFEQAEAGHPYNGYIRALETLRQPLDIPPDTFYLGLLSEPIKTRAAAVIGMARALSVDGRDQFLRTFSAAFTVLKQRPK